MIRQQEEAVKRAIKASAVASELRVGDLMTRAVYTLTPTQSLPLAESIMDTLHVRHIPVVVSEDNQERRLVGLVTHRDLLAAKISRLTPLSENERSTLELSVPVSRVMRTEVWTIAPDADAITAARIMREHRFGCLPVVEGNDRRLVGIVTEADLLTLVTDSLVLVNRRVDVASKQQRKKGMTMEQVMTQVPVTITPNTTIREARALMSRYAIRHLPVIDAMTGKPLSMVCDRELSVAEAIFRETSAETPAAHVARLLGSGTGGACVHQVERTASVATVLETMFRKRLDAVLVVEKDPCDIQKQKIAGIFTVFDACRLAL